jgi:hypothetical protein
MPSSVVRIGSLCAGLLWLAACGGGGTTPIGDTADGDEDGTADGDDAEARDEGGGACTSDEDCSDGIDCTLDACDVVLGICVHEPQDLVCDDGSPCTVGEVCDPASGCIPGTPRDCSDGINCTADECNAMTGACLNTPAHDRCTAPEMCLPDLGGCAIPPPCTGDGDCDDGNPCNGAETCNPDTGCQAGTPIDCDDGVHCTADVCNPADGTCSHTAEDWRCDDGNACNGRESCDATADCRPGTPVNCNDGVSCTDDSCDVATGDCSHTANDARCDDGVFCNGAEICDPAVGCASGPVPACSDGIACTADACNVAADACTHTPDNARCSDGLFCNGAEICVGGVGCTPGTPPVCDDGLSCSTDRCDPAAGGGAGGCIGVSPDRDGDTYGDAACTGNDCNDGVAGVHPGATESCNGVDDDCDGTTDEGFGCAAGSARSCTLGSCTGSQTCSASCTWGSCAVSAAEVCNGLDDNCNGVADEGFACPLGSIQTCSVGACPGYQTCVAGCTWNACTASASEVCNGTDDDCDGLTDEGFSCIVGRTQTCSVGSCTGTQTCQPGCSWGACTVTTAESCNGLDDNCNGATDETFTCRLGAVAACTNACFVAGTQTCTGPLCTWGSCCAASEVCGNACDDNCNGVVDEGCCIGGLSSFLFPSASDSRYIASYPWMWVLGDYYQGARSTTVACATSLTINLVAYSNSLGCDRLDGRILLNGTEVATFSLTPGYSGISGTVTFAPVYGPLYTVRMEVTRQVAPGCGSVSWWEDYSTWTIR